MWLDDGMRGATVTDPVERVAEIVDAHRVKWVSGQKPFRCECGLFVHFDADHAMHVAQAVVDALQLTEERYWHRITADGRTEHAVVGWVEGSGK